MPKAFTQLCENINLSLFNDTLTVYPKQSKSLKIDKDIDFLMIQLFMGMNCTCMQVGKLFAECKTELGIYRFVHRDDPDHHLYHQDSFNMNESHYHAKFAQSLDEFKLDDILNVLERYELISSEEHKNFIKAYHQANTLSDCPHEAKVSKLSIFTVSRKESSEKEKSDSHKKSAFGGFKPGFLLK